MSFFLLFNRVILVISVVLRETTLSISDSTGETVSMDSEIVRVVFLGTNEIFKITRLEKKKKRSLGSVYLNSLPDEKILALFKLKSDFRGQFKCCSNDTILFDRVENIVEKGENGGYQHFLLYLSCL